MTTPKKPPTKEKWGPAEWFGLDVFKLDDAARLAIATDAAKPYKEANRICPSQTNLTGSDKICAKAGGVCSVQRYAKDVDGKILPTGIQVAICPHRITSREVLNEVAPLVLGVEVKPVLIKEVPYSISLVNVGKSGQPSYAGRLDWLLVDRDDPNKFCGVETQSVYMSGKSQNNLFEVFVSSNGAMVMPPHYRRPDYKSSVPKRLAPQLASKARHLSGTGRKTVVIVDEFVFQNMHQLREVEVPAAYSANPEDSATHKFNNSEVIFVIVSIANGNLVITKIAYCRIDDAIASLNAVAAMGKLQFESVVRDIVESTKRTRKPGKKVIDISFN